MWTEDKLEQLLTAPSPALISDMKRIEGDIMVLGAGGKMGPTLCLLAQHAIRQAGTRQKVIAVSRFSNPDAAKQLIREGVEVIPCDLTDSAQLEALPKAPNIIFMAGLKFGTTGNEPRTWFMNAALPAFTARQFPDSRFVVFSSGNVYPLTPVSGGGSRESDPAGPVGEYTQSVLARERLFEYAAQQGTPVLIFRLNYAVDLRYGVLCDLAQRILTGLPIAVDTPAFNCIWQGSANEMAIRSLLHASVPARTLNVTGPETVSVRAAARQLGEYLGKDPVFEGQEGPDAYLSNAQQAMELFGYPSVPVQTLMRWQAEWLMDGGRILNQPTHFEERGGSY